MRRRATPSVERVTFASMISMAAFSGPGPRAAASVKFYISFHEFFSLLDQKFFEIMIFRLSKRLPLILHSSLISLEEPL